MTVSVHRLAQPVAGPEFHTDAPANAEELAIAFETFMAVTEGDRGAAATLAAGAIIADALQRNGKG